MSVAILHLRHTFSSLLFFHFVPPLSCMYCSCSSSGSRSSGWPSFLLVCYILIITLRCSCLSLFSSKCFIETLYRLSSPVAVAAVAIYCLGKEHRTQGHANVCGRRKQKNRHRDANETWREEEKNW